MRDEILSYSAMCAREKTDSLQRGMYFRRPPASSIFLMSRRRNAPYEDVLSDDGTELVYEGHDVLGTEGMNPKSVDQARELPSGRLTENGKFARAADEGQLVLVRVYEKLRQGIWSDKGLFELVGYDYAQVAGRRVFRFRLKLAEEQVTEGPVLVRDSDPSRAIPTWVKQAVYKRDKGRCVLCGAETELHFDHELPYSRGGTGMTPNNVRILCARHNLQKGASIE